MAACSGRSTLALVTAGLLAGAAIVPAMATGAYVHPGRTTQQDLGPGHAQPLKPVPDLSGNVWHYSSISANGRYVAFDSWANNLVSGDTNRVGDVFVRDRNTGLTTRVSVTSNGGEGLPSASSFGVGGSSRPFINSSGQVVAFESVSPNLVAGDTNASRDVFVHDMRTRTTERISVGVGGAQANGASTWPSLSADGRYVAFASAASNLVAGDTNNAPDVFVRDRKTNVTTLVSVEPDGTPFPDAPANDAENLAPSISPDGKLVAFTEMHSHVGLLNLSVDVFARNLRTRKTVQVNVGPGGTPQSTPGTASTPWQSRATVISNNDRYVAFLATGYGLVPNTNGKQGVFVHDLVTGKTAAAMVSPSGEDGDGNGGSGLSLSADGRFVVFSSQSLNLDINYGNSWMTGLDTCLPPGVCDPHRTFVHDMVTGATSMVSRTDDGSDTQPPFQQCGFATIQAKPNLWFPAISADGRYVAFDGCGLAPGEAVNATSAPLGSSRDGEHVYVRDVGLPLTVGGLVGSHALTVAGSHGFDSAGTAAVTDPAIDVNSALTAAGANLVGAALAYRPEYGDFFVRWKLAHMPAFVLANPTLVYGLNLTVGTARYQVRIAKTGLAASFGLFRMAAGGWTHVADLRGGYGTTGEEVVAALPLTDIGAQHGARLSSVDAFTALGSYQLGGTSVVDHVAL
jgi:Tol biopolymer transport system component